MHTVGYVRVSTKRQANEGVSLDVQQDRIEAYNCASATMRGRALPAVRKIPVSDGVAISAPRAPRFSRILYSLLFALISTPRRSAYSINANSITDVIERRSVSASC